MSISTDENNRDENTAAQDRDWLREVGQRDLNDIHHALRMIVKHPMVSGEEARLFTNLADACWNEHARRAEKSEAA